MANEKRKQDKAQHALRNLRHPPTQPTGRWRMRYEKLRRLGIFWSLGGPLESAVGFI